MPCHSIPFHSNRIEFNKSLSHMCVSAHTRRHTGMCVDLRTLSSCADHRFNFDWMIERERANEKFPMWEDQITGFEFIVQTKYENKKEKYFPNIIVWNGPTEMQTLRPLRIDYYSGTRTLALPNEIRISEKRECSSVCVYRWLWNEKEAAIKW